MTITLAERAAIIAASAAEHAHHESGHAVAAVARGGWLCEIRLGVPDWDSDDDASDLPGYTRHRTRTENRPFVTFAGPWASARFRVEADPEASDLEYQLEYAFEESDDDAAAFGDAEWEDHWFDELEVLWPSNCAVAAKLLAGDNVTHATVLDAISESGA